MEKQEPTKFETPTADEAKQERADNDGSWKNLIEHLWAYFILRTLPELYADIDFSRQPEFLMQELKDPLPEAAQHNSPYFVDELIKVPLKNGQQLWLYLHIEVQGPGGEDISYRMYLYHCLIVSHYHEVPVALAVLTSPRPVAERQKDSLGKYELSRYKKRVLYEYEYIELYALDDNEMLNSDNPVDLAFYAAKKATTCQDKERQKFAYLRELTRVLNEKGWGEKERREIFSFIARIINLKDQALRTEYLQEIKSMKEETGVESFVEKYFRDEGRSEGRMEGRREANFETARRMREAGMDDTDIHRFTDLSLEELRVL